MPLPEGDKGLKYTYARVIGAQFILMQALIRLQGLLDEVTDTQMTDSSQLLVKLNYQLQLIISEIISVH